MGYLRGVTCFQFLHEVLGVAQLLVSQLYQGYTRSQLVGLYDALHVVHKEKYINGLLFKGG